MVHQADEDDNNKADGKIEASGTRRLGHRGVQLRDIRTDERGLVGTSYYSVLWFVKGRESWRLCVERVFWTRRVSLFPANDRIHGAGATVDPYAAHVLALRTGNDNSCQMYVYISTIHLQDACVTWRVS